MDVQVRSILSPSMTWTQKAYLMSLKAGLPLLGPRVQLFYN